MVALVVNNYVKFDIEVIHLVKHFFVQMSDYDDLLTNEDDDMSVTESSATSCDWETEEEEQVPGNDTGIESGNLTSRFAFSSYLIKSA